MKQINLFRALPVACALSAVVYLAVAEISPNRTDGLMTFVLGLIVASVFCIQIRLGRLPWFEKKDGQPHRLILWLEEVFPKLRGPRK